MSLDFSNKKHFGQREVFALYYYGIWVFLGISEVIDGKIYAYELETRWDRKTNSVHLVKAADNFSFKGKDKKKCLFIDSNVEHNCWTGKTKSVRPHLTISKDENGKIKVNYKIYAHENKKSRIYQAAVKLGAYKPWEMTYHNIPFILLTDDQSKDFRYFTKKLFPLKRMEEISSYVKEEKAKKQENLENKHIASC